MSCKNYQKFNKLTGKLLSLAMKSTNTYCYKNIVFEKMHTVLTFVIIAITLKYQLSVIKTIKLVMSIINYF